MVCKLNLNETNDNKKTPFFTAQEKEDMRKHQL